MLLNGVVTVCYETSYTLMIEAMLDGYKRVTNNKNFIFSFNHSVLLRVLMNIFTLLSVQSYSSKWHTKSNCSPQMYIWRTIPIILLSIFYPPYNITQAVRQKKLIWKPDFIERSSDISSSISWKLSILKVWTMVVIKQKQLSFCDQKHGRKNIKWFFLLVF